MKSVIPDGGCQLYTGLMAPNWRGKSAQDYSNYAQFVSDHKDHTREVKDHGFSRHNHQNIKELLRHYPGVIQKITTYFLLS